MRDNLILASQLVKYCIGDTVVDYQPYRRWCVATCQVKRSKEASSDVVSFLISIEACYANFFEN